MIKLVIDNIVVETNEGTTILEAAKQVGIEIPHFCYHPSLSKPANCRLCAVEVKGHDQPVMSCQQEVAPGMEVLTNSSLALDTRRQVLEFILINHPVDCPVCDQSGECKLQDYYQAYSLQPSRFAEKKVAKTKARPIGKQVILDAERCVECTRCIRFCEEITKTKELVITKRSDQSEIAVFPDQQLDNPYSLCTVDLCPVGALTSRDFRFLKRVWFLETRPSICAACANGCNIYVDHADGKVFRFRARENQDINKYWLCDQGRLSYKKNNAQDRITRPFIYIDHKPIYVSWPKAISEVIKLIVETDSQDMVGVLSATATNEENQAFFELYKDELKVSQICYSGLDEDYSFGDNFLRKADRNPNQKGVWQITKQRLEKPGHYGYIILDGISPNELARIAHAKPKWMVLVTTQHNLDISFPNIVLPKATHLEQAGSFINFSGIEQRFEKVLEPKDEALSGVEIARLIGSHCKEPFGS
ncbi:MAG: 2Fe-2S iron-sulfur cluster-binding protein [Pseudomonadota bacterium]